ncbi:MAG: DUF4236 domain-containing protein [Enterobacter sp.]
MNKPLVLQGVTMSFYIKKSIRVGPMRFNLSKSGVGASIGIKGLRLSVLIQEEIRSIKRCLSSLSCFAFTKPCPTGQKEGSTCFRRISNTT